MYLLFIVLLFQSDPVQSIRLETGGLRLNQLNIGFMRLAFDGTFLAATGDTLWHWRGDGSLIHRLRGRDMAFGKLEYIGDYLWDGQIYWLIDFFRSASAVFNKSGGLVTTSDISFRQIQKVGDLLFVVDSNAYDFSAENYPPVLRNIHYGFQDGKFQVTPGEWWFKKVTRRQVAFKFNFKLVWMAREGDTFYVVDQLEPHILVYDAETREREAAVAEDTPFDPPTIAMQLTEYIMPPFGFAPGKDLRQWMNSWSRINHFSISGKHFIVVYSIPNPDDDGMSLLQVLQKLERNGKAARPALIVGGLFMGYHLGQAFFLFENKHGPNSAYDVQIYDY